MATLVQPRTDARERTVTQTAADRLVLLASDGSPAAFAATRVAAAFAQATGASTRVISVLHPQLYPPPTYEAGIGAAVTSALLETELRQRVRLLGSQIDAAHGGAWPVDTEVGPPATIIVREARRHGASVVVMGLRPHPAMDRWLRDETTLRVVRGSPVPVVAVVPTLTELPRRVAVAVDFSRASLRAAREAVRLVAPGGTLQIVYVRPKVQRNEQNEGATIIHSQGMAGAFARLRHELTVPGGVDVEAVILEGEPAPELISFAERANVELIAVGSHRHPFLTRMLVGSVTSALVRNAQCSLLVAPPTEGMAH